MMFFNDHPTSSRRSRAISLNSASSSGLRSSAGSSNKFLVILSFLTIDLVVVGQIRGYSAMTASLIFR